MAPEEVQVSWTGKSGLPLLEQSLSFVRACAAAYADANGEALAAKRILDFGCGYGRFLTLFSFYSDDVIGVDPWDKSIEQCQIAGLGEKVRLSVALTESLPVSGPFDFIFSFSVFTHLSERATKACLSAIRQVTAPGAPMMITIRPVEFWEIAAAGKTHLPSAPAKMNGLIKAHNTRGFAYYPAEGTAIGDYGDTSMSLDWLAANAHGWELESVDRSPNDPYQRYVMLRAV